MCVKLLQYVQIFVTPWSVACQAPLSMGFSRQEDEWVAISSSRGSNPCHLHLLYWQVDSLQLSCQGSNNLTVTPMHSFLTLRHGSFMEPPHELAPAADTAL